MVFTDTVEGDVFEHDHLLVPLFEADREILFGVKREARQYLLVHVGDAAWRALQPFALRVFAYSFQYLAHGGHYLLAVQSPPPALRSENRADYNTGYRPAGTGAAQKARIALMSSVPSLTAP